MFSAPLGRLDHFSHHPVLERLGAVRGRGVLRGGGTTRRMGAGTGAFVFTKSVKK